MKIFLSHINEESQIAQTLKEWIESTFQGNAEVFVSSDKGSLPPGKKWLDVISENLVGRVFLGKTCVIVECRYSLVVGLCSNFSRSMLKSRTITTFVFQVDTKKS